MYESQQNADLISTLTQEFNEVRKKFFGNLEMRVSIFIYLFIYFIFISVCCNYRAQGDYKQTVCGIMEYPN